MTPGLQSPNRTNERIYGWFLGTFAFMSPRPPPEEETTAHVPDTSDPKERVKDLGITPAQVIIPHVQRGVVVYTRIGSRKTSTVRSVFRCVYYFPFLLG